MDYQLHYSGRAHGGMALLDELAALHGKRLHVYASDENCRNDFPALLARPAEGTQIYACGPQRMLDRSEEHTSELQSLMRISYAVFCLKKKNTYRNAKSRL